MRKDEGGRLNEIRPSSFSLPPSEDSGIDRLKRFLAFFGNQPQAGVARTELLHRLTQAGRILEAELLMASTAPVSVPCTALRSEGTGREIGTDRKAQAGLLADMAVLNFNAHRVSDAAACFRQLQREFADVPWQERWKAKGGRMNELPPSAFRLPPSEAAWPVGEVEASKSGGENTPNGGYRCDMLFGGPRGPSSAIPA